MQGRSIVVAAGLLAAIALPEWAAAQTGPELLLKPFRDEDQFEVTGSTLFGFETETSNNISPGNPYDYRNDIFNAQGRLRLTNGFSEEGIARAQPRAGFSWSNVDLTTEDPNLPQDMSDVSVGFGMGILAVDGWLGGISFGVGYAAADTASDANGTYLQGDFVVGKTFSNGVDTLGFVVDFNGNRSILPDVPLPGFQFRKQLDDTKIFAVGFPFSGLEWTPTEELTIEIQYNIPDSFEARADYEFFEDNESSGSLFASYRSHFYAAHWDELDSGHDRVLFRQRFLEGGLLYRYSDRLLLTAAAGYVLDSDYEVGFDTRNTQGLADIDPYPYLRAEFELRL